MVHGAWEEVPEFFYPFIMRHLITPLISSSGLTSYLQYFLFIQRIRLNCPKTLPRIPALKHQHFY